MDLQLKDRTALVTGASMGIGRAAAKALAQEGVRVGIAARRVEALDKLAQEIVEAGGPEPVVLPVDLYEADATQKLAAAAQDRLGQVDILVNSAGGSRPVKWDAPRAAWEEGMTLNYTRIQELTSELLPGMAARNWGRVISLTGTSEPRWPNTAFPAKAALHMWSKSISRDLAKLGVTIHCIQPGRIMSEQIYRLHPTEEDRRAFCEREIPMGRFGEPEELANLIVFLASPRAAYMTGTVIPVDGGMYRFAY
ncbi:SDR family oxidoreductase [Pigmentiphaga soli]|uniref:SDR family oxidoreductase n=1 Tax=Pigmentiphaga soli TaxID=1007095 RepID=A0ABP8HRV7_9BURK